MEPNDFWTHIGLVASFFLGVVAPRLLSPGHTLNSMIYIAGGAVVIVVATAARYRAKAHGSTDAIALSEGSGP
jgi:hypothetical protein